MSDSSETPQFDDDILRVSQIPNLIPEHCRDTIAFANGNTIHTIEPKHRNRVGALYYIADNEVP